MGSSVSSTWTTASAPGGRGAPVVIRHTPPDDTSTLGCRHEERIRDRVFTESAPGVISLPSLQRSLDPELFSRLARQQLHNQPTHPPIINISCSYMLSLCAKHHCVISPPPCSFFCSLTHLHKARSIPTKCMHAKKEHLLSAPEVTRTKCIKTKCY
jgi:hypothetical protein